MKEKDVKTEAVDALTAFLANVPEVSEQDLKELESAVRALDSDAAFVADFLKGLFVEDVLRALEEEGVSQNALAGRLNKSRQYLSKVLNQDNRVNFTIDTMAEIGVALKRQLYIRLLGPTETATIFRIESKPTTVRPMKKLEAERQAYVSPSDRGFTPAKRVSEWKGVRYGRTSMQTGRVLCNAVAS
ncbi:MAG: helix-turn-helix domain-containing protein [Verrucomicrobia bacterium]|nr:helix-turn-helix domain-containing protein [Verrucomicrobiota bacterium]